MSLVSLTRVALLASGLASCAVEPAERAGAHMPMVGIEPATSPRLTPLRIVVVHWKIKLGREAEFLNYWSTRSVIGDRSGLVGEYLSSIADRDRVPWITWQSLNSGYTSYFNMGIWRDLNAFQDQIGRFIDNSKPPLPFEAERRERVFLVPEAWRIGRGTLPTTDAPGVK